MRVFQVRDVVNAGADGHRAPARRRVERRLNVVVRHPADPRDLPRRAHGRGRELVQRGAGGDDRRVGRRARDQRNQHQRCAGPLRWTATRRARGPAEAPARHGWARQLALRRQWGMIRCHVLLQQIWRAASPVDGATPPGRSPVGSRDFVGDTLATGPIALGVNRCPVNARFGRRVARTVSRPTRPIDRNSHPEADLGSARNIGSKDGLSVPTPCFLLISVVVRPADCAVAADRGGEVGLAPARRAAT